MEQEQTGRIKWFSVDLGYGFIVKDNGGDIFVHHSGLKCDKEKLKGDEPVTFSIEANGERGDKAVEVQLAG